MSEVDGEEALPPLGDDDKVAAGPVVGWVAAAVGLEVDATGCRCSYRLVSIEKPVLRFGQVRSIWRLMQRNEEKVKEAAKFKTLC